jgi:hypothetical protein
LVTVNSVLLVKSRRARAVGMAALLACLALLGAVVVRSWSGPSPEASAPTDVVQLPSEPAAAARAPVVEAPEPQSDIPVVDPDQLPSEAQPASPRPKAAQGARRPRVDCKVPFTVDANGMKHFRAECFR